VKGLPFDFSGHILTRTSQNQKGLITKTRKLESTKFFFAFVFSSFRAFVINKFFHKGIKTVLKGDYFLDSAVSTQVVETLMKLQGKETKITDARYGQLTAREQEVLRPLAEGLSSKEIAQKLFISPKTVENHRANIMNKLDLHSTIELVRYAAKLGLIDVDLWTN
jgi:DNA-binding NarL/FixJ family response regulator